MSPAALLFVYCVFIFAASNAGGRLSDLIQMTHLRTQLLMSGVGGLMLGIAMLHLLPHAGELLQSSSKTGMGALIGVVSMFLLIRLFHTHDHGGPISRSRAAEAAPQHVHDHDHGHDCDGHSHAAQQPSKRFGWAGVFFGLALHTLIDGVALASSVIADASHGSWYGLAGIGTFLVIALHIPLDSFAITSVMSKQGWSAGAQRLASMLFSLACPLGAFLMYLGATTVLDGSDVLGWGLAVSAGFFICIALADLLPEVAFHDHDRVKLTVALLLGVVIAIGIENLPGHDHSHGPDDQPGHNHHF
ncbi:ZIP family metal transporter [Stieleria sp. TO1_6]|nr:ZIP family metal transporter [Stieleria tagensis]